MHLPRDRKHQKVVTGNRELQAETMLLAGAGDSPGGSGVLVVTCSRNEYL